MKVITKQSLCQNVAQRWDRQYTPFYASQPDKRFVYVALCYLNGCGTEAQITEIIGNSAWTRNGCSECEEEVQTVVQVGQEPDWDSATAQVCISCLQKAIALIEGEPSTAAASASQEVKP